MRKLGMARSARRALRCVVLVRRVEPGSIYGVDLFDFPLQVWAERWLRRHGVTR